MAGPEDNWDEQVAVTGRPQDEPQPNTTFADRASARRPKQQSAKAVQDAENKSVSGGQASRKRK